MTKPIDLDRILELAEASRYEDPTSLSPIQERPYFVQVAMKSKRYDLLQELPDETITALAQELKEARQAVAFYADEINWWVSNRGYCESIITPDVELSKGGGKRARAFQEKWGLNE